MYHQIRLPHHLNLAIMLKSLNAFGKYLFAVPFLVFGVMHFLGTKDMSSSVAYMPGGGALWIYITGAAMIAYAISIFLGKLDKLASYLCVLLLLIMTFMIHVSHSTISTDEGNGHIANLLKNLGLIGGALIYAGYYAKDSSYVGTSFDGLNGLGKYFFAIPFLIFGVLHIMGANNMAGQVDYMPGGGVLWIYLTGASMIAFAISVFIGKWDLLASYLCIFLLLVMTFFIHIPHTGEDVGHLVNLLKNIGLIGIALMYAGACARDNSFIG